MNSPILPDQDGLKWGYTHSFWHVLRDQRPAALPVEEVGKWFAFLPSDAFPAAQASFRRLARNVLCDPRSRELCHKAKIALAPLYQTPDRLVVVFYGAIAQKEELLELLKTHSQAERKQLRAEGLVQPRDGFLQHWTFKEEVQTLHELKTQTSEAHLSILLQLVGEPVGKPRVPRGRPR